MLTKTGLLVSLLAALILSGCVRQKDASASSSPHIYQDYNWNFNGIQALIDSSPQVRCKKIMTIEILARDQLKVTAGKAGFLSGGGEFIKIIYRDGSWSIVDVVEFDS
jgi:hypothetical protein